MAQEHMYGALNKEGTQYSKVIDLPARLAN